MKLAKPSDVASDDSVFNSLLVEINTGRERRFWFLRAVSWNQHTSFNMISLDSRYSKSAHFFLDESVLDSLRVENSTRLETRLWLWLVGFQNQHTFPYRSLQIPLHFSYGRNSFIYSNDILNTALRKDKQCLLIHWGISSSGAITSRNCNRWKKL